MIAHTQTRTTPSAIDAGAVIYARDLARLAAFYAAVAGLDEGGCEHDHVVLQRGRFELVIVAVPEAIADSIRISEPPQRRENVAIKPVFFVESLDTARRIVSEWGGAMNPSDRQWRFGHWQVCDGHDPEGNVFQLRQPEAATLRSTHEETAA